MTTGGSEEDVARALSRFVSLLRTFPSLLVPGWLAKVTSDCKYPIFLALPVDSKRRRHLDIGGRRWEHRPRLCRLGRGGGGGRGGKRWRWHFDGYHWQCPVHTRRRGLNPGRPLFSCQHRVNQHHHLWIVWTRRWSRPRCHPWYVVLRVSGWWRGGLVRFSMMGGEAGGGDEG